MKNRGAGFLFMHGDKILLLKKTGKNLWDIPGGHKESKESFLDAAKRETIEEIGLLPDFTKLGFFLSESKKYKFKIYFAKVSNLFSCIISQEHESWDWFDINKLPHKLHKKIRGAIEFIIRQKEKSKSDWFTSF